MKNPQYQTTNVSINGIDSNIHLWGNPEKPPLFFIHGFLDVGSSFKFLCEKLCKNYYCIAPDLRGFGKSGHTENPLGYFFYEYVADLHSFFDIYSPKEKIKAVGHSMGGNIFSIYAGTFPKRVSHFVNVEGFGLTDIKHEEGPKRLRRWIEGSMDISSYNEYSTIDELVLKLIKHNPSFQNEIATFWANEMSTVTNSKIRLTADPKHRRINPYLYQLSQVYAFWEAIQAKCCLITAENSEMKKWLNGNEGFKVELERRFSHYPKHSERYEVKNCGHMIHLEQPQELTEIIKKFLANDEIETP